MVYEDEIPKELEKGKVYPSKQISYFIKFNKNVSVISEDAKSFPEIDNLSFKVTEVFDAYFHQVVNDTYRLPNIKQKVYLVTQV